MKTRTLIGVAIILLLGTGQAFAARQGKEGAAVHAQDADRTWHYPNIPDSFSGGIGLIKLLHTASSKVEIMQWAEKTYPGPDMYQVYVPGNPDADGIVIIDVSNSGIFAYDVHLFIRNPNVETGPKSWQLISVQPRRVSPKHLRDVECVYIDPKNKTLVFAKRSGEIIKALSLDKELEIVAKWQQEAGERNPVKR